MGQYILNLSLRNKTIFWSSTWLQNKSQKNEQAWLVYKQKNINKFYTKFYIPTKDRQSFYPTLIYASN